MEYLLLFIEYILIRKFDIFKNLSFSIIIGFLIYFCANDSFYIENSINYHNNIISVLGILIGFSISVFTILLSIDNKAIQEAKNEKYIKKIFGKDISLFESIVVGIAYVIILESILLIINFVCPLFVDIKTTFGKLYFSINLAILIYIILTLMRSVLDFYFIITKREKNG